MLIKFVCGNCDARLKIESTYAGQKIECPECESGVRVPSNEIAPGVVIGGFEIKKLIGKGGMGEVYLAKQLSMGRDVALKILPAALTRDKSLVDRFLQEVRNSAQLNHPNIVTAYEAGEDDGIYFMAMAFVKGETLDHTLQTSGFMQERESLNLIRDVANALRAAWDEHQMIHRDIKPENIMTDHKGTPMVLDMGLSKSIHDQASLSTSPDTIMGSPNFMSPEQTQDSVNVDFRTDMYSLGTSLYNMLTAKVPFHGNSYMETLKKQATGQLKDPRNYNPDISEGCLLFMERLLAKAPEDRFDSWDELIAALDRVIQDGSLDASQGPTGESMLSHGDDANAQAVLDSGVNKAPTEITKKSPALGMLLFLALLGGSIVAFFILTQNKQQPEALTGVNLPEVPGISNPTTPVGQPAVEPYEGPSAVAKAYSEAALFWQSNPTSYDEALTKLEVVGNTAPNSEYALRAVNLIDEIKRKRDQHVSLVVDNLRNKGQALVAEDRIDEAIELLENYAGPLANETRSQRGQAITALHNQQRRIQAEQTQMDEQAKLRAAQITHQVIDHLLDGNSDEADALMSKTQAALIDNHYADLLTTAKDLLARYHQIPNTVLKSYELDLNNELQVETQRGVESLQIKRVSDKNVSAIRKIKNGNVVVGHSVVEFGYDDLNTQEKVNRLDKSGVEDKDLLKGLVYYQSGSISAARTLFDTSPSETGKLLKHRLDVRLGLVQEKPKVDIPEFPKRPGGIRPFNDRLKQPGPRTPRPGGVPPRIQANPRDN